MSFRFKRGREAATPASSRSRAAVRARYRRLQLESLESRIVLDAAPTLTMPNPPTFQDGTGQGGYSISIFISVPNSDASDQESLVEQVTAGTLTFNGLFNPVSITDSFPLVGMTSITNADGSYELFGSDGLVAYQGTGPATGYVAVNGTAQAIDEAISLLGYQPPPLLGGGSAVLSVLAENADGANPTTQSIPINITPDDVAPIIDGPSNEDMVAGTLTFSSANHNAITVADADANGGVESVQVKVMNGTLEIGPNSSGLTSLTGNATNWLELRGSISALNAALDGLQYTPDAGTTSDFLDASIDDLNTIGGDAKTTLLGTNIVVSTFPESGLNFGISGYGQESASESTGLTFSAANGNPITVYGTDNITQPLTAYLQVLNGTLTVTNTSAAVTIAANGTSLISVTGTTDAIDQTLDGLVYQPTGNASSDIIEGFMTAPEGTNLFAPQEWAPITINPGADDLPLVIGIPGPQTVAAGSELTFSHGGGGIVRNGDNALSVADGDANGSTETVFLQVLYGTLAVGNTAGLGSASGNGTSLLILSGTVPNLNAALDGLRYLYAPPADSPSGDGSINSDYLSILISDNAPVTYNSASAGVQISIT